MLKKENALGTAQIRVCRKKGSNRFYYSTRYTFQCVDCGAQIHVDASKFHRHSGKCSPCGQKKVPFFHLFNRLLNGAKHKNLNVNLTFEEFLEFTKTNSCHYCLTFIPWEPFCYKKGKYKPSGYYLDRVDNTLGYSKNNCVVCCTRCNYGKSGDYSYQEWFGMTKYFRDNESNV